MELIADGLLVAGALGAAFYCFILSRRLTKFNDLESGVGGAVAVLSGQVDDLTKALERARRGADRETEKLEDLTARAEAAAAQLELMMAAMHDLPDPAPARKHPASTAAPHRSETASSREPEAFSARPSEAARARSAAPSSRPPEPSETEPRPETENRTPMFSRAARRA